MSAELINLPSAVLAAGQGAGLIPAERCVALLTGIRDSRLISRTSFLQMKNVRDARRQGIPLAMVQHEDVLVFTRPGQQFAQAAGLVETTKREPTCTVAAAGRQAATAAFRSRTCARRGRWGGH